MQLNVARAEIPCGVGGPRIEVCHARTDTFSMDCHSVLDLRNPAVAAVGLSAKAQRSVFSGGVGTSGGFQRGVARSVASGRHRETKTYLDQFVGGSVSGRGNFVCQWFREQSFY